MNEDNSYLIMENSLLSNLRPVQPNPDFIQNLGKRLLGSNNISIEGQNNSIALVLISLGLFLGVLLVWLFRKH
jgi:hypothetical protein